MKYELPCCIVEDLLPSYVDGLINDITAKSVKEHLDSCEDCSKIFEAMSADDETNKIIVNDKKLLKKSKKKIMKKLVMSSVITAIVVAIVMSLCYVCWYAYWGRRHSVLYDVPTVYVSQDSENSNIYHLTYNVTVKNWSHDFSHHTYKLVDDIGGSLAWDWNFSGESDYFTTSSEEIDFTIKASFDMNAYDESSVYNYSGYEPTAEEKIETVIHYSEFAAQDENGDFIDGASLYMLDNMDVDIIFEWNN